MPRYFFDIHDGVSQHDLVGKEFPDRDAVSAEAARLASVFVTKPGMSDEGGGAVLLNVHDGAGTTVCTLRLVFTFEPGRGRQSREPLIAE